jgi:hypothetical protein
LVGFSYQVSGWEERLAKSQLIIGELRGEVQFFLVPESR